MLDGCVANMQSTDEAHRSSLDGQNRVIGSACIQKAVLSEILSRSERLDNSQ